MGRDSSSQNHTQGDCMSSEWEWLVEDLLAMASDVAGRLGHPSRAELVKSPSYQSLESAHPSIAKRLLRTINSAAGRP